MSDPISRLLEAIEAREQKALEAAPGPWRPNAEHDEVYAADDIPVCEGFALSNNQLRNTVDFIVDNDPSSALRHCKADRELVELHGIVWRNIGWLEWDEGEHAEVYEEIPVCGLCVPKHSSFPRREDVPEGPCRTVRILVEGYGISEEEK